MASKSKKRRRVLGASCILAALIIAGSSFAWFTSKDEVTNRLTANSDYGVSIVESFVPPANMIPGQEVNKDVYAVNTGNIAAFVKETVSGVLNYTYETVVDSFDPTCVQLNGTAHAVIDGATTHEAGGFLAWTDAIDPTTGETYEVGPINSARNDDVADTENQPGVEDPQWTPPAAGNYIFRRSIKTASSGHGNPNDDDYVAPTAAEFEYAGYYYDGNGNYYKIILGNETGAATYNPETGNYEFDINANQTALGVTPNADGTFDTAPQIRYVMLKNVENAVPVLTYKEGNIDGVDGDEKYLEAVYSDNAGTQANIEQKLTDLNNAKQDLADAEAALYGLNTARAQAEVDYQNALAAYNSAKTRYDQTKADYDYAKALTDASNALLRASKVRKEAQDDYQEAADLLEEKALALKNAATAFSTALDAAYNATTNASTAIVTNPVRSIITSGTAGYEGVDYQYAQDNLTAFDNKWTDDIVPAYTAMNNALTALKGMNTGNVTPDTPDNFASYLPSSDKYEDVNNDVEDYMNTISTNLEAFKKAVKEYNDLYAAFTSTLAESSLSGLLNGGSTDTVDTFLTNANALSDTALSTAASEYISAYDAYYEQRNTTIPGADNDWLKAVKKYNDDVDTAEAKYADDIDYSNIDLPNWYENNGDNQHDGFTNNHDTLSAFYYAMSGDPAVIDQDNDGYSVANDAAAPNVAYTEGDVQATIPYTTVYGYLDADGNATNYVEIVDDEDDFVQLTGDPDTASPQTLGALETAMNTAYNTAFGEGGTVTEPVAGSKKAAYDAAVQAYTDGQQAITDAGAAVTAAQGVYDAATAGDPTSTIKMLIVLDDDAVDTATPADGNWTMVNDGTKAVDFYLNNILEAGVTSDKLIDYVMLSPEVTTMDYKDLTFDLNINLESAQVTYDANQRDYTAEAANGVFAPMTATVGDDNSTVEWADSTPAPTPDPDPTPDPAPVHVYDSQVTITNVGTFGYDDGETWADLASREDVLNVYNYNGQDYIVPHMTSWLIDGDNNHVLASSLINGGTTYATTATAP